MIKLLEILEEKFITPDIKGVNKNISIQWIDSISDKNINAAIEYLNLHVPRKVAEILIEKFKKHKTRIEYYKAKDIFRASDLKPLPMDNEGVAKKKIKVESGIPLEPILLARYNNKLYIADGYHRTSFVYNTKGENERVACVLVGYN